MFKLSDKALVVESGKITTVLDPRWIRATETGSEECIKTTDGNFAEAELRQAHPTVLATAEAKPRNHATELARKSEAEKRMESFNFELSVKVTDALSKAKLELDVRGHWKGKISTWHRKEIMSDLKYLGLLRSPSEEDLKTLHEALQTNKKLNIWIDLGRGMFSSECTYCGEGHFSLLTDGKTLRLSGDECSQPNGFEHNEWELNVPSGKIVVENDLREWFPLPEGDGEIESVNGIIGCRQTSQAYAAVGMSHAFVGNSCPSVYRMSDSSFKIANAPEEEYYDEDKDEYVPYDPPIAFEGELLTSICTDLWWYSMCDLDEATRRAEKFGGLGKLTVIDVKPGVYRFRHDDEADRDAYETGVLYGTFEWIRDPDPVKDFLKEYQEAEVNAHAYVQAQVKLWPTLYGAAKGPSGTRIPWADMTKEQRLSSWERVADHIFCVLGGGTNWHEKGFPTAKIDLSVQDIEPPSFRQQCNWYPFSEGYGGLFSIPNLSPSFAKLAFRVLESVISFGSNVRDDSHSRDVAGERSRMLLAVKTYRKLAKVHPDFADPDYVLWLGQEGRAEAWVERFDLGPVITQKHRDHVAKQRWIPEDTYAVEFDAKKMEASGHFTGRGCWAQKEHATGFAIEECSKEEGSSFWTVHAAATAVPLYSVARVIKLGEVSHMGKTLVELAYDYGTEWMQDTSVRKALNEKECKKAIRILTKKQYEKLLPKAKKFAQGVKKKVKK